MTGCNCPSCHGCRPVTKAMLKQHLKIIRARDKQIEKNIEKMITMQVFQKVAVAQGEFVDGFAMLHLEERGVFD